VFFDISVGFPIPFGSRFLHLEAPIVQFLLRFGSAIDKWASDRAFVNDYPHFRKACLGYSRSFGLFAKHR
jgi:hypothetical protein